jgi:hypothetical protein
MGNSYGQQYTYDDRLQSRGKLEHWSRCEIDRVLEELAASPSAATVA